MITINEVRLRYFNAQRVIVERLLPPQANLKKLKLHWRCGVTTLATLTGVARWGWCCPSGPIPNDVVVARTHAHGLAFARDADMRYYARRVSGVRLAGLALVADQPLRSTRSIQPSALTRVLADRMAPKPQGWDVEHRCQTAGTAALSTRPLDPPRPAEVC